nr:hypothetical protein [Candidatus Levybacteria bacterium]
MSTHIETGTSPVTGPVIEQLASLGYEGLPAESPHSYNAFFIGRSFDLRGLALIAGLPVSASNDGTSVTWANTDEISLRLAPTPDDKPGVWISGIPFTASYEGEDGDSRSKLIGEEGDLIVAGNNKIVVVLKDGTNPKRMCIPGTDTVIPSINARIIDADGRLSEIMLPERTIRDIFEEADTGIAPYPDY